MRTKGSLLVAVLFSLACGGGDGKGITDPGPVAPPVTEVLTGQITGINETVIVADTSALAGQVVNAQGATVGVQSFSWISSDTTVGRVSSSPSLRFVAKKAGSTVISFIALSTSGKTVTASKTVTVAPDTAKTIAWGVPDTIGTGLGFLASAMIRGVNGATLSAPVTYSITGSGQMDADNFVVVGTTGTVTISATASGLTASKQVRIGPAPVPIRVVLINAAAVPVFMKVAIYAGAARWQRMFSAPLPAATRYFNMPDRGVPVGDYNSADGIIMVINHQIETSGAGGGNAGQLIVLGHPMTGGRVSGTPPSSQSNRFISLAGQVYLRSQATPEYTPTSSGAQQGRSPQGWIDLVTHEIGHGLGITDPATGYSNDTERIGGNLTTDPRWIGTEAMRQYQMAGGRLTGGVPMRINGHWRSCEMMDEMMSGGSVLSAITLGALIDRGYSMSLGRAEPYQVQYSVCGPGSV